LGCYAGALVVGVNGKSDLDQEGALARIRELFDRIGMMHHLGVEVSSIDEESAEIFFVADERHRNYMDSLHGGAIAAAIDTVAFMPASLLPSGRKLTTEGMEIHFFRPAKMGEKIRARAKILRNGRRVVTLECDALREDGKKIAHAIVTLLDLEA
jgi:uncharacterized protein (TIGR00369 family)